MPSSGGVRPEPSGAPSSADLAASRAGPGRRSPGSGWFCRRRSGRGGRAARPSADRSDAPSSALTAPNDLPRVGDREHVHVCTLRWRAGRRRAVRSGEPAGRWRPGGWGQPAMAERQQGRSPQRPVSRPLSLSAAGQRLGHEPGPALAFELRPLILHPVLVRLLQPQLAVALEPRRREARPLATAVDDRAAGLGLRARSRGTGSCSPSAAMSENVAAAPSPVSHSWISRMPGVSIRMPPPGQHDHLPAGAGVAALAVRDRARPGSRAGRGRPGG